MPLKRPALLFRENSNIKDDDASLEIPDASDELILNTYEQPGTAAHNNLSRAGNSNPSDVDMEMLLTSILNAQDFEPNSSNHSTTHVVSDNPALHCHISFCYVPCVGIRGARWSYGQEHQALVLWSHGEAFKSQFMHVIAGKVPCPTP